MNTSAETVICAVLIGNAASSSQAEDLASRSRNCPYVASYSCTGNVVIGVFALPLSKRWWIDYPQQRPEVLGLQKAAVFVTDRVSVSSPWSQGAVQPLLASAPCGTSCDGCPQYRSRCSGCPATVHFMG